VPDPAANFWRLRPLATRSSRIRWISAAECSRRFGFAMVGPPLVGRRQYDRDEITLVDAVA
jgi:hypothetical protein